MLQGAGDPYSGSEDKAIAACLQDKPTHWQLEHGSDHGRRCRGCLLSSILMIAVIIVIAIIMMTARLPIFPFSVFASAGIDRQYCCSGRAANAGVRIGEGDGSGVGTRGKAANVDQ